MSDPSDVGLVVEGHTRHSVVRGRAYRDNSGVWQEIPVILTEHGPLMPLARYLAFVGHARSQSWMNKLVLGVSLLLDYFLANRSCFEDSRDLFVAFAGALHSGTIGPDGIDPSGLYWFGRGESAVRGLLGPITALSDWLADRDGTRPLNPWRTATRGEEALAWAAWHQRRDRAFLGHTYSSSAAAVELRRARSVMLGRTPVVDRGATKIFPRERILDLLFAGFIVPGRQTSPRLEERLNVRDILITMLMHYGGVRVSEPFHLFVHDVAANPLHPDQALVRIYHPSSGAVPPDAGVPGLKQQPLNRQAYLRTRYGLLPRNLYSTTNQLHAGWKGNALEGGGNFFYVFWSSTWAAELFLKLWIYYMSTRSQLDCIHPFAFVTEKGDPYSLDTFMGQHAKAVERIGLIPAKVLGTTAHGHRHAYGQKLAKAKIGALVIKKAMHHRSLESQAIYTEPEYEQVQSMIEESLRRSDGNEPDRPNLADFGFHDFDPLGLLAKEENRFRRIANATTSQAR